MSKRPGMNPEATLWDVFCELDRRRAALAIGSMTSPVQAQRYAAASHVIDEFWSARDAAEVRKAGKEAV
jgi:hypothetical protein